VTPRSQVDGASSSSEEVRKTRATDSVRTEPGQKTTKTDGSPKDTLELSREAQEIRALQLRDKEVRSHEAAHAAAGGQYAGSPSFSYTKGSDGRSYVTDGEVSIDISSVPGDPEATLQKANQVRAAALAPAQPSSQDMKVAQKAQMMAAKARQELADEPITDSSTETDAQEPTDASVEENGPSMARLQDSAYQAYAGDVSQFISFSIIS
jgi:hypothetical protein